MNAREKAFLELSVLLTGFDDLPIQLSNNYLARLDATAGYKPHVTSLLSSAETLEDLVGRLSVEERTCCKGITFLWYTGEVVPWVSLNKDQIDRHRVPGSQEEYYGGLIWKAIRAHPLSLTGAYYGHWKYEPEN